MWWVAEEKFGGEAADCDVSAADGVEEGRVGVDTLGIVLYVVL